MADWCGTARSNYFRVRDENAFKAWAARLGLECWPCDDNDGSFAIAGEQASGGWPTSVDDDGEEGLREVDVIRELAAHLADGEIAVLMEIGAEKLRYVTGNAVALDNTGRCVSLRLADIYDLAGAEFGWPPGAAEY